jgi:hypothetical protein
MIWLLIYISYKYYIFEQLLSMLSCQGVVLFGFVRLHGVLCVSRKRCTSLETLMLLP